MQIEMKAAFIKELLDLGAKAFSARNFDLAIAGFTVAIQLDPQSSTAYYIRAQAYRDKGEKGKAEADLAEAKRLGYAEDRNAN
jgi:Tfp pilus assembly protein PilF